MESPPAVETTDCAVVKQHPSPASSSPAGCGAITTAFIQGRPFSHQLFRPHCAFLAAAASGIARKIDSSIADNADKFLRLVKSFASENPFLKQLSTITSEYQNFCQAQRRNHHLNLQNSVSRHLNFAAVLPGDSIASVVVANGLMNFLNLYNTLLVVRLVLTWFPNTPPAVVSPLSTICDPYLNIFRGIIPPLGGTLDLSPILAFLVLNAFTSAAAALPAELPPAVAGELQQEIRSSEMHDDLTSSQKKWLRRVHGDRSKNHKNIK